MLLPTGQLQGDLHDDALLGHIARLVHHIGPKPQDVSCEDLGEVTLGARLAESDVVDEGSVTTSRIKKEESTFLTLIEE